MSQIQLIIVIPLLLIACEKLDAPETKLVPNSIRIGFIDNPPIDQVAQMAAMEINKSGGVLGRKVEIIRAFDRFDSAYAPQVVQFLALQGVSSIVGGACSDATLRDLETVASPDNLDIVMVSHSATSPMLSGVPNFYRTVPSDLIQGKVLAKEIFAQGLRRISVVSLDSIYGHGLTGAFEETFVDLGGLITVKIFFPELKTSDFDREIEAVFAAGNPEALLMIMSPEGGSAFTREIRALMKDVSNIRFYGTDSMFSQSFLLNADAEVAEGMQGTFPAPNDEQANFRLFLSNFHAVVKTFPLGFETAEGIGRAASVYDAVYLIAYSMVKANAATSAGVRSAIIQVSGTNKGVGTVINVDEFKKGVALLQAGEAINYEGASGSLDLDAKGDPSRGTYLLWQIRNRSYEFPRVVPFP